MNIGRNDPCPCGSGKKYKRCCYLQNNNNDTDISLEEVDTDDYDDYFFNTPEEFYDPGIFLKALTNLRSFSLDRKSHIKEYKKARALHSEIINTMVRYHEAGKFRLKIDIDYINSIEHSNKSMGEFHLIESDFDLETREGAQTLYDLLIYKASPNMNCITEEFIKSHRYRKKEKIEFLHSMLDSTIGLFEVIKTDTEEGYVYLKDIFSDIEYKIVDIAMSGSTVYDDIYMYTRLIKYHDIIFNTGLNLIFNKKDSFIKNHIRDYKKDYTPEVELLRLVQLYNYYSNNPNKMEIVTNTIK
jgi:hypothetical protein